MDLQVGDTVVLVGGNAAHLMTVRAIDRHMVLCAFVGPSGTVQFAPYLPQELELHEPRPPQQPGEVSP